MTWYTGPLIIKHSFIITCPHRNFFKNNTVFHRIIYHCWLKRSKLQPKENIERRNLILQHAKENKWNRNSLNNQIITTFPVLFLCCHFDDERIIMNGLTMPTWGKSNFYILSMDISHIIYKIGLCLQCFHFILFQQKWQFIIGSISKTCYSFLTNFCRQHN